MASEEISECLNFPGGACPQTPLAYSHLSTCNVCTSLKYLVPALLYMLAQQSCEVRVHYLCHLLLTQQETVFQLSDSSIRTAILNDLLQALESQLTDSPSTWMVAIATELSMLYMILLKKWARLVSQS